MTTSSPELGRRALWLVFAFALAGHFLLATWNWRAGFLIGHEFRQTHTAVVAQYIDQDDNFSLKYQTPVLGKPWECPREFPLYQWCVVIVRRVFDLPLYEAARGVALACFYLALPAIWLLAGDFGLSPPRRALLVSLVLTSPVYLFYSRTFLIESMALMFSVWFTAAFVRTMRERDWRWVAVASVCGALAGTIKSLTFAVWVLPAAIHGAWCLGQEWRLRRRWRPLATTAAWGLATVAVPAIASIAWLRYTDSFNAVHPSANMFAAKELTVGNLGTVNLAQFQATTWRLLFECWNVAVIQPWLLAALVLLGLVGRLGVAGRVAIAAGGFFLAQFLFPLAYALQDYYFYACTVYVVGAFGFVLHGVLDSGWPRWLRWVVVAVPFAGQLWAYHGYYRPMQAVRSPGGSGLTEALRAFVPRQGVLIIAGQDWAPIIPYYSGRRALMIRNGLENDQAYLDRAFRDLADEPVAALVLADGLRERRDLVQRAAAAFGLDSEPAFSHRTADVYMTPLLRDAAAAALGAMNNFDGITARAQSPFASTNPGDPVAVPRPIAETSFAMVSPAPSMYRFQFGFGTWSVDGRTVLNAHPASDLWVPVEPGGRRLRLRYGILEAAYTREGDHTNGVEFAVSIENPGGERREIFRRVLDPDRTPADRGTQSAEIPFTAAAGEVLVFTTRPNGQLAFDWSYWERIDVR